MIGRLTQKVKHNINRLFLAGFHKPLPPPTAEEQRHIEALRERVREIDAAEGDLVSDQWAEYRRSLRQEIQERDPRGFTNWESINHVAFWIPDKTEFLQLRRRRDWFRWRDAIAEDRVGHPEPYILYPRSSGNLIHHAYSVAEFLDHTRRRVEDMSTVVEFGGGYGSTARLFYRLGFRGHYVIYDLPEYCALQEYFLSSVGLGLDVAYQTVHEPGEMRVSLLSKPEDLAKIPEVDLFVALWSVSECPFELRETIWSQLPAIKNYLIAYQHRYGDFDNLAYFEKLRATRDDIHWFDYEIEHLRTSVVFDGNRYLLGAKT